MKTAKTLQKLHNGPYSFVFKEAQITLAGFMFLYFASTGCFCCKIKAAESLKVAGKLQHRWPNWRKYKRSSEQKFRFGTS